MKKALELINNIDNLLEMSDRADEFTPSIAKPMNTASAAEDNFSKHIPDSVKKVPSLNDKNDHVYSSIYGNEKKFGPRLNSFHDELKTGGTHLGSYTPKGMPQEDISKPTISHYSMGGNHYLVNHKSDQTTHIATSHYGAQTMSNSFNRMNNN